MRFPRQLELVAGSSRVQLNFEWTSRSLG